MSANFKESFPLLILFFPGVLTHFWTTQYPLFTVLQCQTPQSVYITGVYSFKIKSVGKWELEMLFRRQGGSSEGKGDAATPFFQIYFTTSLKEQTTTIILNLFPFPVFSWCVRIQHLFRSIRSILLLLVQQQTEV